MQKINRNNAEKLFKAIISLKNIEECSAFFDDICTIQELEAIAQRFAVAKMLNEKKVYNEIIENSNKEKEEINNKIDEMVINGSFNTILEPYMSTVNNRLDSQDAKINALRNGAPLSATSVSQMTDTSKVYVNTSDGKWYYYNGTNWVVGGVYQSTQIANNSVDMGKFTTDIQNHYEIKQNYVKGSVSNNTGEFMTSTTRIRTFKKI